MPNYLSPGVYVEEVEAGSRPIEGVGTAVAAFVGLAARGPANTPTLVTNWNQFTSTFGDFIEGSYLAHAVYGYFLNGGGAAYVVRVGADGVMPTASAELPSAADKGKPAFRVAALESGPSGNDLTVEVEAPADAPEGTFKLVVKQGGKPVETYDNLSTGKGKQNVATVVKAQSQDDHDRGGRRRGCPGVRIGHPVGRRLRGPRARHPQGLRRQLLRPDRLRRPRGGGRGHDAVRAGPRCPCTSRASSTSRACRPCSWR